jgi:hypothetical protein
VPRKVRAEFNAEPQPYLDTGFDDFDENAAGREERKAGLAELELMAPEFVRVLANVHLPTGTCYEIEATVISSAL